MHKVYKNARINGIITDIVVDDGKFSYIGKTYEQGVELNGNKVFPGLIDIHTHGCIGYDTMDGRYLQEMSAFHVSRGVTAWLPTTMTSSMDTIKKITDTDIHNINGARVLGFHLEGPYISEEYKGAQNGKYIQKPDLEEFSKVKNVKMVTIAPELDGAMEFIQKCECVVSLGHTGSDYDTAIRAIETGASCLTHIFNAMPPIHHRKPAVIGAAVEKNIYAQVICDGLHIHPSIILLLYKLFGSDRMVLISDSMRAAGLPDGEYELGGQTVFVKNKEARLSDGTLAGSVCPLLGCVKNAISFGISEMNSFKMASETPAQLLGINKGKIKAGYDADFIVLDNNLNILSTVIDGREEYKNESNCM